MKPKYVLLSILVMALLTVPIVGISERSEREQGVYQSSRSQYPIMHPDSEALHKSLKSCNFSLQRSTNLQGPSQRGSYSLLSHLSYVPAERDQGSCGNCWVWAGTGVLEVALDSNEAVFDRLSVQYFNSKYNGGTGPSWAGCGGWLSDFSQFYADEGFAIPWSNTNAFYADAHQTSEDGTSVPWQTISTVPNYTISQCTVQSIATHDVGQNVAINNIKNVIDQGKAVWFGYFLATETDWNQFFNFWDYQSENITWSPDFSCGHVWNSGGGGHAVLCVGYNDLDPNNSYWIMVNSWGTAYGGRPNGIFHVNMNMNYDCYFFDPYPHAYYSLYWQTLNVTYDMEHIDYSISLESQQDTGSTVNQGTVVFDGTSYSLPANVSQEIGNYSVTYLANDGYIFDHWQTFGNITVSNVTTSMTYVTVSGEGVLRAVYKESAWQAYILSDFNSLFAQNNVQVIYPSDNTSKPLGRHWASTSDWTASAFLTTKLSHSTEGTDAMSSFVNQTSGKPVGHQGVGIISFGGPFVNVPVYYYELTKTAPIIHCSTPGSHELNEPWSLWYYANGTSITATAADVDEHNDFFLIEVFQDMDGRYVLLAYGISGKGTYAAGKYFHSTIYPNITSYNFSWIIVKWEDTNADGFVNSPNDGDTYTIMASGI
jgi:C1A family cysteine protease